jgi:hypothetical protein
MSRKLVRLADELDGSKAAFVHALHGRAIWIFCLKPTFRAPGFVGQIFSLCDDTLVPEFARVIKNHMARHTLNVIDELNPSSTFARKSTSSSLRSMSGCLRNVCAADLQQIKCT